MIGKMKLTWWKKLFSPSCGNITLKEEFISKINGVQGFTWIKSGVVMKEAFKDWKINFTLGPQIKVEWKGPLSWNNVQWIVDKN
jgi:hypothetical protein